MTADSMLLAVAGVLGLLIGFSGVAVLVPSHFMDVLRRAEELSRRHMMTARHRIAASTGCTSPRHWR